MKVKEIWPSQSENPSIVSFSTPIEKSECTKSCLVKKFGQFSQNVPQYCHSPHLFTNLNVLRFMTCIDEIWPTVPFSTTIAKAECANIHNM